MSTCVGLQIFERGYEMKSTIAFKDEATYKNVVKLFYDDPVLMGYDIDTVDGETLLVPKESLERLNQLEVSYIIM